MRFEDDDVVVPKSSRQRRTQRSTPKTQAFTFADFPIEAQGILGTFVTGYGVAIGLNPDSDPDTVLVVGIDQPGEHRLAAGEVIDAGEIVKGIYVKLSAKLPQDSSRKIYLDFFLDRGQARYMTKPLQSVKSSSSGSPNQAAVTVATTTTLILAANAKRELARITNNDPVKVLYVNAGAPATVAGGEPIQPGSYLEYRTTAAINGIVGSGTLDTRYYEGQSS